MYLFNKMFLQRINTRWHEVKNALLANTNTASTREKQFKTSEASRQQLEHHSLDTSTKRQYKRNIHIYFSLNARIVQLILRDVGGSFVILHFGTSCLCVR
mmetsp:Transcript_58713/g.70038  ORF Transcript_58713/g.70038 Transcript_58713/m.70038 type:complete len:100 (-) Transcript_58713:844-1143(-)